MYRKQNLLSFNINHNYELSPIKSSAIRKQPDEGYHKHSLSPSPSATSTSEIGFLKKKLVQTHNKLLDQLQKAKQYQRQIMDKTEELDKYKQIVKIRDRELIQKNQELRNRRQETNKKQVEAKKLQSQSKLKQPVKVSDDAIKFTSEIKSLKAQINNLHLVLQSKQHQNKQMVTRYETMKKKHEQINSEHEEELRVLHSRAIDSRKLHFQIQALEEQNAHLEQKMKDLQFQCQTMEEQNDQLKNQLQVFIKDRSYSSNKNRAFDQMKYQNSRLSSLLQQKQRQLQSTRIKLKAMEPQKRRGLQQTKRMIQKLEEVQHLTRSRGTLKHNLSQSTIGKGKREESYSRKKQRKIIQKEMTFYDDHYE